MTQGSTVKPDLNRGFLRSRRSLLVVAMISECLSILLEGDWYRLQIEKLSLSVGDGY